MVNTLFGPKVVSKSPGRGSRQYKSQSFVENQYEPEQFQLDIHRSKATYNALLGSPGLGKTILGSQELAIFIRHCQGNGMIIMPTYGMAYQVALRELRKWIPQSIFIPRNPQNNIIELGNGRVIFIRSADHPETIDGCNNVSFIWIDEGDLISDDVWQRARERLLRQRPGINDKSRVIVTATPQLVGGKSWLRDVFWMQYLNNNDDYYCRKATIWESTRINEDLKQAIALEAPPGTWARARYDAEWAIIADGLIYPEMPKLGRIHANYNILDSDEIILGVDCGYRDPFVACLMGVKSGVWTVFAETRCVGRDESEIARQIDAMLQKNRITFSVRAYHDHDPNQVANIANRVKSRIQWILAEKQDREARLGYVRDLMILKRFQFDSGLHALHNEFAGYKWKETGTKQEPEHQFSHGPDAVGYGIWSHVLLSNQKPRFIYASRRY